MQSKTRNLIGWILTGLLVVLFLYSASMKFLANAETVKNATLWGLGGGSLTWIGLLEVTSLILFVTPRTGVLGTLLLTAYLGGAIATHLEHHMPVLPPIIIECVVWITATIRFPELSKRLMGNKTIA